MNQKNLFTRSALAAAIALISSNVSAAGFQLNEYSAAALGRAFSGEGAVADNASVGSRNPAAMTLFDRPSFSGGVIYIDQVLISRGRRQVAKVRMPVTLRHQRGFRISTLLCHWMNSGQSVLLRPLTTV